MCIRDSHLRNRLSQMGASPQYINDDLPCFNAWIEGEGGYRKLDDPHRIRLAYRKDSDSAGHIP